MSARASRTLLALALLAHLALVFYGAEHPEASLRFDRASGRLEAAQDLARVDSWDDALRLVSTQAALGDYGWHALLFRIAGESVVTLQLVQLALLAASMLALRRIVLDLDGRPSVAWTALALYAVIPIDFMIPHFLASEAFFTPLLMLGTCAFLRSVVGARPVLAAIAAGVCTGLAAMTRGDLLPWLPVAIGFAALLAWRGALVRGKRVVILLAVLALGIPAVSIGLRSVAVGELAYGGGGASVEDNVRFRMKAIRAAAGEPAPGPEESTVGALAQEALRHPALFVREWAFHSAKLLALPENLDVFRYFDLYTWTGRRSEIVHTLGWLEGVRATFREMPLAVIWLGAGMLLMGVLWLAFAAGVVTFLRRAEPVQRLLALLLLSLPVVYVAMRLVAEGEARKRAPVDFVLVTFAALGLAWLAERRRGASRLATP